MEHGHDDGSVWQRPGGPAGPPAWDVVPQGVTSPAQQQPVAWAAPAPAPAPVPSPRRRTGLLVTAVAVGALLLGGLGGAIGGVRAADDQDRVDALSGEVSGLEGQVADLEGEVADTRAQAADDVAAARDQAESAVAAENAATVADLDARAADLDGREAAVTAREDAVTVLEQQAADGSIPGDGVYLVGEEVAPGTYRAQSPGEYCYWERLSGLSGSFDDLISNGLGPADAAVTVSASDVAFSTEGCGTWARIG